MTSLQFSPLFFLIYCAIETGRFLQRLLSFVFFSALQTAGRFNGETKWKISAGVDFNLHLHEYFSPRWHFNPPLHEEIFYKSQQDPNPSRRVNPGLEKRYPARWVDLGWLLWSCKYLLQVDNRRADALRRTEANLGF